MESSFPSKCICLNRKHTLLRRMKISPVSIPLHMLQCNIDVIFEIFEKSDTADNLVYILTILIKSSMNRYRKSRRTQCMESVYILYIYIYIFVFFYFLGYNYSYVKPFLKIWDYPPHIFFLLVGRF